MRRRGLILLIVLVVAAAIVGTYRFAYTMGISDGGRRLRQTEVRFKHESPVTRSAYRLVATLPVGGVRDNPERQVRPGVVPDRAPVGAAEHLPQVHPPRGQPEPRGAGVLRMLQAISPVVSRRLMGRR